MKYYRDLKNSIDTAKEEAVEKRDREIARLMMEAGEPIEKISKFTGLTVVQIEKLIGK